MHAEPTVTRSLNILIVDDDPNDVVLVREAFAMAGAAVRIEHAANGVACMNRLRQRKDDGKPALIDLVLLDLYMTGMDGREVMAQIAADPELRHLPVVVLSTSKDADDRMDLYRLRCSSFIVKPLNFSQLVAATRNIVQYWGCTTALPLE